MPLVLNMLHEFIIENRERIIQRTQERVSANATRQITTSQLNDRIRLFLAQLVDALAAIDAGGPPASGPALDESGLFDAAVTVAEMAQAYNELCRVINELAVEVSVAVSVSESHTVNRCLDAAIARAVTAFAVRHEMDSSEAATERLGCLGHELRNLLNTAVLAFELIERGAVGVGGSTSAVLARSLSGLGALIEGTLAEVRLEARVPILESVSVLEVIQETGIVALIQAEARGLRFIVDAGECDATIFVARQLLMSALSNLLQNAFKFTRFNGTVSLKVRLTEERVLIDVQDECGGLLPGKAAELFRPFTQRSQDRSGLGLGLTIAHKAVRANAGDLLVRDLPGQGCVFTIDLPRKAAPVSSEFRIASAGNMPEPVESAPGSGERVRGFAS